MGEQIELCRIFKLLSSKDGIIEIFSRNNRAMICKHDGPMRGYFFLHRPSKTEITWRKIGD